MFGATEKCRWKQSKAEQGAGKSREREELGKGSLSLGNIWGWWRGKGHTKASPAWGFPHLSILKCCFAAALLLHKHTRVILFILCTHRSLKLTIIFWKFVQFLRQCLSPTTSLNYCPSRAKLVLSWICCTLATASWSSPQKPHCAEHVEHIRALWQFTQLRSHNLLPCTKPCPRTVTISIETELLKVLQIKGKFGVHIKLSNFTAFQVLLQLKNKKPESDICIYQKHEKYTIIRTN